MPIVNVYEVERIKARIRNGEGECFGATAFTGDAFRSKITGVGMTVIPPGAGIGDHPHGNEEEIYFVMEGEGIAELDGRKQPVKKGDVLFNVMGGTHGLSNSGDEDLVIFAFCVAE